MFQAVSWKLLKLDFIFLCLQGKSKANAQSKDKNTRNPNKAKPKNILAQNKKASIKGFQLQNRGRQTGDLGWTVAHIWSYGSETSHFRSVQEGLNRRKKTKASRKRTINQPFRLHDRACWPEKISAFSDQSTAESANLTSPRRIAAHTQIHKRKKAVNAYSEMRKTHNWIRTSRSNSWMY